MAKGGYNKPWSASAIAEKKLELLAAIRSGKALTLTDAAQLCGIGRYTAWEWTHDDLEFKEQWDKAKLAVYDNMLDFCETNLLANIAKGDNTAIIFFLKSQGRVRGFQEKIDVNQTITHQIDIDEAARRIAFAMNSALERGQMIEGQYTDVVTVDAVASPADEARAMIGEQLKAEKKQGNAKRKGFGVLPKKEKDSAPAPASS